MQKKKYLFPLVCQPCGHYSNSLADPDPGSGAFLTPGSGLRDPGWVKSQDQPRSYFPELRNHFWGLKYLNSGCGSGIRDPGWKEFGSGIQDGKKFDPGSGINIPDPQYYIQTYLFLLPLFDNSA
jgi:hypothetical protein